MHLPGPTSAPDDSLFRRLVEDSPDIIFRYRIQPVAALEYVNRAIGGTLGYTPQQCYDDVELVRRLVHPEDRLLLADALARSLAPSTLVVRTQHHAGHCVWLELHSRPVYGVDGALVAVEGVARDISVQHSESERQRLLQAALEATASAIVVTDRDGTIEWVNSAFTELTGYPAEEAIGMNPRLLKSGVQPDVYYDELWATISAGRVWRGELINRRKDGSLYTEEQTITPLRTAGGLITHFIGVKHDVTTRVEQERERAVLVGMSAALRDAPTRTELLPSLLTNTLRLTDGTAALLAISDASSDTLLFEAGAGAWAALGGTPAPQPTSVTGEVMRRGEPLVSSASPLDDALPQLQLPEERGVAVCVPLRVGGAVIGALWVAYQRPLTAADVRTLAALGDLAAGAIQRASLAEQTGRRLERLAGLRAIDMAITSSLDLRLTLRLVLEQATLLLHVDAADVLQLDPHQHVLTYVAGRGFRTDQVSASRVRLGEGLAGRVALERSAVGVPNFRYADVPFARRQLLAVEDFVAYYAVPLIARGQVKGVLEVFHRSSLQPDAEWISYLEALAGQAAIAIDNVSLFTELQRSNIELALAYDTTLEGWSRALDLRDKETEGHTQRVTDVTVELARALGLSEDEIVHVRRGALLHDIGKMGIPDAILLKPGPLTDEEWAIMQRHPVYAYELLAPISYLRPALDIPYCHHERWDGTGYPRGLRGEQIPLAARIFAVVDVWDALSSDRPYRPAWPAARVYAHLRAAAGTQFDPRAVEAFLALQGVW